MKLTATAANAATSVRPDGVARIRRMTERHSSCTCPGKVERAPLTGRGVRGDPVSELIAADPRDSQSRPSVGLAVDIALSLKSSV
jgi:hypothetical protein